MREWKTQFDRVGRFISRSGDRIRKTYSPVFDERGSFHLEESGSDSIYDYIQSFADSVDINVILKRFMNGDTSSLSRVQGFYADFSGMPTDYASIMNIVTKGQEMFDSMPVDVRAKFGHNFHEFMVALSEGRLGDILGVPSPADPELSLETPPSPPVE